MRTTCHHLLVNNKRAFLRWTGLSSVHALRLHDPNDNSLNRVGAPSFVDEVAIALGTDSSHGYSGDGGTVGELVRLRAAGVISAVGLGMNCNKEAHMGAPEEVSILFL